MLAFDLNLLLKSQKFEEVLNKSKRLALDAAAYATSKFPGPLLRTVLLNETYRVRIVCV